MRGFRILRLGLDPDRQALYDRINRRAQQMFEAGLIEETQRLVEKYGEAAGPLSFARIQAGGAISSWRTHSRAGGASRSASSPQLCQAADDLVSPRAGGSLAARFRRRCADSARSRGSHQEPRSPRISRILADDPTGRAMPFISAIVLCMPRTLALLLFILTLCLGSTCQRQISAPRPHSSNPRRRKMGGEDSAQADPRRESRPGLHDLVPRQLSQRGKSGIPAVAAKRCRSITWARSP